MPELHGLLRRNGRKPVMLTPMVGYLISIGVWIANIYYWVGLRFYHKHLFLCCLQESPANYLLATGVYSFFGGFTCLLVGKREKPVLGLCDRHIPGLYSYLADITSVSTRTARIGLLDVFLFAGVPVGIFTSAYIYKFSGYYGIFVTSLVLQVTTSIKHDDKYFSGFQFPLHCLVHLRHARTKLAVLLP